MDSTLLDRDTDTQSELEALRIENEILRSQLSGLEAKLDLLDETLSPTSKVEDSKDLSALAPPGDSEISDLTDMMVQIQLAKEEAMKHGDSESSRDKLIDDINYLYGLLMKAKEERMQLIGQQGALKDKLKRQKVAHEKLQAKKVQDKIIFVEMLKRERVTFEQKLVESDKKVLWFEQEMRRVADWARNRQTEYNKAAIVMQQEINRAKQEASDQAHTINQDLAGELESLQCEATEMLR